MYVYNSSETTLLPLGPSELYQHCNSEISIEKAWWEFLMVFSLHLLEVELNVQLIRASAWSR